MSRQRLRPGDVSRARAWEESYYTRAMRTPVEDRTDTQREALHDLADKHTDQEGDGTDAD